MKENILFTDFEKTIILDKDFLKAKTIIIDKIHIQLEETRKRISDIINQSNFKFEKLIDKKIGKIFKGENYLSLPYVVLDYPKLFSKENTFTFRTMFWWGNYFSSTLHLEGFYLEKYKEIIFDRQHLLKNKNIYFSVAKTPWEYHFNKSNYILIDKINLETQSQRKFIKLSKRFEFSDYENLPELSSQYFSFLLKILSNE
ncbi:MAG: hypothetical protein IPH62_15865 [Ignavibacteriae bacterium]|nr:hypothetical protein [Ignavibacteriota bacterium]